MNARAISTILAALVLAASPPARAQTSESPEGAEGAEEAPQEPSRRERFAPTSGKLPVEDPTIHEERDPAPEPKEPEAKTPKAAPKQETAKDGAAEEPEKTEEPGDLEDTEDEATTGALPVEDPTIEIEGEPATDDGTEPTEDSTDTPPEKPEPKEKPEEQQDDDDWAQPVKVAYRYPGGLLVSVDDWFYLALSGLVQARYAVNYRTKPPTNIETGEREKQVTQGFDVARARFQLGVGLTEFVALYMRIGVVSGGEFSFQRAFVDLKWKYFRIRAGLFMNETIAESLINPNDLYFNDYSIVENVFTPGSSKGVMFTYLRKRFSINLGYSDGLRTGFSEIRSPSRADFAVTLRTQYAWGDRGLAGFNRLFARRGAPFGVRLGGALHYQDGGRSQGTTDVKIALGTIDLSFRGNGWSVLLSATSGQDARVESTEALQTFEVINSGFSVMGGYFVLKDLQVFGQYAIVTKPRIQGEPPPSTPGLPQSDPSTFQAFGVGFSYFVVPGRDNVKLSSDFQYFLGRERGSSVPASPLNNIQPNDDGSQFFWRVQLNAAF